MCASGELGNLLRSARRRAASDVGALRVPAGVGKRREIAERALLHARVETSRFGFLKNRLVLTGRDALRPALLSDFARWSGGE